MSADPNQTALEAAGVPATLAALASDLARGETVSVEAYLRAVGVPVVLDGTCATARTHFIICDPNGRPRVEALARKLATQTVEYCIPRTRIKEANDYFERFGSAEKFIQLASEARQLFTGLEKSGEGGELLLYFLLEVYLKIPQLLCKMSLKTSVNMHVHGTDGVHASLLENGTLALYWGESKMHATASSAIDDCFHSLAPFLQADDDSSRRDILLLRDNLDAGNAQLTQALVRYFIDDSPEASKVEVRGACLVGFNWDEYPEPYDEDGQAVRREVAEVIAKWHGKLSHNIKNYKLCAINIEIFCVPVPSVDLFRAAIKKELGR